MNYRFESPLTRIPTVLCPECGQHMRLSEISIDPAFEDTTRYICACGFEYEQSALVAHERQRGL